MKILRFPVVRYFNNDYQNKVFSFKSMTWGFRSIRYYLLNILLFYLTPSL